ncbi:kti12, chromatin associated [Savitreella phatthalungensis]
MPLVILSGLPCSGKTTLAERFKEDIERRIARRDSLQDASTQTPPTSRPAKSTVQRVVLVNDASLHLRKSEYDATFREKNARAALISAVSRSISRDTIVVVDAMNYVKGFRYQLFCEAKAMSTPCCCVHIGCPDDTCRSWNLSRPADQAYPTKVFEELLMRFEEPNASSRWDSPLYTVFSPDLDARIPTRALCAHIAPDLVFDDAHEADLPDFVPDFLDSGDHDLADDNASTIPSLAHRLAQANLEPPTHTHVPLPSAVPRGAMLDGDDDSSSATDVSSLAGGRSSDGEDDDNEEDDAEGDRDEVGSLAPAHAHGTPSRFQRRGVGGGVRSARGSVTSTGSSRSMASVRSTTTSMAADRAKKLAAGIAGDAKPNGATVLLKPKPQDYLFKLDKALSSVISTVAAAIAAKESHVDIDCSLDGVTMAGESGVESPHSVKLSLLDEAGREPLAQANVKFRTRSGAVSELLRLKRAFLSIHRNVNTVASAGRSQDQDGLASSHAGIDTRKTLFVEYLGSRLPFV